MLLLIADVGKHRQDLGKDDGEGWEEEEGEEEEEAGERRSCMKEIFRQNRAGFPNTFVVSA